MLIVSAPCDIGIDPEIALAKEIVVSVRNSTFAPEKVGGLPNITLVGLETEFMVPIVVPSDEYKTRPISPLTKFVSTPVTVLVVV